MLIKSKAGNSWIFLVHNFILHFEQSEKTHIVLIALLLHADSS